MFRGRAYLVNNAFTFNFLVVRGWMKGEISARVHLSLAENRTVSLSWMLTGRLSSENRRITAGLLSPSTKTSPDKCSRSVTTPSGTACHARRNVRNECQLFGKLSKTRVCGANRQNAMTACTEIDCRCLLMQGNDDFYSCTNFK